MSICWITEFLGTGSARAARHVKGVKIVDVRDLVDKSGNRESAVRQKIKSGVDYLNNGYKTIVCCDYGISRSNAVAAGIIAVHQKISFFDAVNFVIAKTGEKEIKLAPLEVVRKVVHSDHNIKKRDDKRTILVTGASGFIGSVVCKQLEHHVKIIAPSSETLNVEQGVTPLALLTAEHNVDSILHLANPRVYTSNIALGKTLTMLRNVLEVCSVQKLSLIYPSGWEIYSGYEGHLLADETLPAFARGPYGDTKCLAELLIRQFQMQSGLHCAVLRSSPLYGSGSDKPKFIYNFIDKARNNEAIVTHRYLNGEAALDLLHVNDFADAVVKTCLQRYTGYLNLGTGITTSTTFIAEFIRKELGSKSVVQQTLIDANTSIIGMNHKRATRYLGWVPQIQLHDGLKTLLSNIKEEG